MNTTAEKTTVDQPAKPRRQRKKNPSNGWQNRQRLVIDRNRTPQTHATAIRLLAAANKKERGRAVTFDHLAALALSKVTAADVERLKNESLSDMDKVNLKLNDHNRRHKTQLTLGQFLVQELKIKTATDPQEEQS